MKCYHQALFFILQFLFLTVGVLAYILCIRLWLFLLKGGGVEAYKFTIKMTFCKLQLKRKIMPVNVSFLPLLCRCLPSLTPSETQADSSVITVSNSQDDAASLNFFRGAQASNA